MNETASSSPPIACNPGVFSKEERQEHATRSKELLVRRPARREEQADGYVFHYEGNEELFLAMARFAAFEHRCCPWLRFSVEMEPFSGDAPGALCLRMTGGAGTGAL